MFLRLQELTDVTEKAGQDIQAKKVLVFPKTALSCTAQSSLQRVVLLMHMTFCHLWHCM